MLSIKVDNLAHDISKGGQDVPDTAQLREQMPRIHQSQRGARNTTARFVNDQPSDARTTLEANRHSAEVVHPPTGLNLICTRVDGQDARNKELSVKMSKLSSQDSVEGGEGADTPNENIQRGK